LVGYLVGWLVNYTLTQLQQESSGRNATTEGTKVQGDSYRTPGSLWPVIFERKVGSRWNLLRNIAISCRYCACVTWRGLHRCHSVHALRKYTLLRPWITLYTRR